MGFFRGSVTGSSNTEGSRLGTKDSGLSITAQAWHRLPRTGRYRQNGIGGGIKVRATWDEDLQKTIMRVYLYSAHGEQFLGTAEIPTDHAGNRPARFRPCNI